MQQSHHIGNQTHVTDEGRHGGGPFAAKNEGKQPLHMPVQAKGRLNPYGATGLGQGAGAHTAQSRGTKQGAKQGPHRETPAPDAQGQGQRTPGRQVGQLLVEIHPEPDAKHHQQLGQQQNHKTEGSPVGEQQGCKQQQAGHLPINPQQAHQGSLLADRRPDQEH